MPNGQGIKKETFIDADEKTRIALTFDLLEEIHSNQCKQLEACDGRFKKLENRKKFDTASAIGSGGGVAFLTVWLKGLFGGG